MYSGHIKKMCPMLTIGFGVNFSREVVTELKEKKQICQTEIMESIMPYKRKQLM